MEAVRAAYTAYTAPYVVLPAANAAADFWDSIATGRIGRAKFLDATAQLFLRLQPAGPAVSAHIPPPEIPHLARLQQAGILVPGAALPSGFKFPIQWDVGAATAVWRDMKEVAVQRWKDVAHFVKSLRDFAVAQVPIAGGAGIVAGPLLPVVAGAPDPANLLLQQQLAKQQADHAAALIAIQAQMAAQAASHAAALAAVPAASCGSGGGPRCTGPTGGGFRLHDLYREVVTGITGCFGGVRPAGMSLQVHLCPELAAEDPETLAGPWATLELLQVRDFLLKKTLKEWQLFVALVDPAFVTTDFQGLGGGPAAAGAGARAMPVAGGAAAGALAMVPRTPTKPELYRQRESDIEAAVRGDPVSEEAAQFTGGGSLVTRLAPLMPSGGLHQGVDLRAFLHIAIGCPSKEQGRVLLSFHARFKLRASQFGFPIMLELYDFLMKLIGEDRADMSQHRVHTVWQEF
ncbi:hypothetical protein CYMTET_27292 [Cymbomonas tetramitiformis]|uniref:Uncharacterized protein n=1 Tax=Cymbomonas tetramitiformis TaxID=36881 RepID=A0AAE0FQP6_9CHLO|nr:hypothetical protein CYMTET_27292 [Cymbomonas tetramitiformis]